MVDQRSADAGAETARGPSRRRNAALFCAFIGIGVLELSGATAIAAPSTINAIGIENQYADVISQIGGKYVHVAAIETDPNTDPHGFELSPIIAHEIASADLIVENGVGYDGWADKIIAAAPKASRRVINVQHLLNLPDSTRNPHLWYDLKTMPAVADATADDLSALLPEERSLFLANASRFKASLQPWYDAIATFKEDDPNIPVAVTEPIADYLLQAVGANILTPFSLQAAIMNGTDPAPQDVSFQNGLFTRHVVKLLVYNRQVTNSLTQSFLDLAKANGIPVLGMYETMPVPGFTYQSWMLAEVKALRRAAADKAWAATPAGD
jgi:zinc/manganese transport system substrate-binding protein